MLERGTNWLALSYRDVKPDLDECPLPTESLPASAADAHAGLSRNSALHADLDHVALDAVIYWCEPVNDGRSHPRPWAEESGPIGPSQVVGDYVKDCPACTST